MSEPNRRAPLAGVRVIEFCQYVAGPLAGRMLSDLGAEVIKMEFAPRGDLVRYYPPLRAGVSVGTIAYNRGKRSVCIDVKKPAGASLAADLICRCDVMLENFSPGVLAKYGLGYEQLSRRNPRLIVCSITGYGQDGPWAHKPANDVVALASSGLLHLIGDPDGAPAIPSMTMGDCSGGIHGFGAVCAALYMRERTGEGQHIDLSLNECLAHLLDNFYVMYQITDGKVVPKRTGSHHPSVSPMGAFRARDGYVTLACMIDQWPLFTRLIGRPEMATDPRFDTMENRIRNRTAVTEAVEAWLQSFESRDQPLEILDRNHILSAPVLDVPQAMESAQMRSRGALETVSYPGVGDVRLCKTPLKFSNADVHVTSNPPLLGEHNREVLSALLGMPEEQIAALTNAGILVQEEGAGG
ncbi:MAG TPA: CoA transferase [Candidatus Binataceae bacterium]|nr:CoA transferase [Candidatus Binataceae bacterium]